MLVDDHNAADAAVFLAPDEAVLSLRPAEPGRIAGRLARAEARGEDDLIALLTSPGTAQRIRALTLIIARREASTRVAHAVLNAYQADAPFYCRPYVLEALLALPPEQAATAAGEVVTVVLHETHDAIQTRALLLARGLAPDLALPIYVRYVESGSPAVQLAAYATARFAVGGLTRMRIEALKSKGSSDALRAVGQLEELAPARRTVAK